MNHQLFFRPQPVRMSLVSRTKLSGVGKHYGVYLEYGPLWKEILDLQDGIGLRLVSVGEFARSRTLSTELDLAGFSQTAPAWERVREFAASPPSYHFLQRNCEHIARRIMLGRFESPQIAVLLFAAGAIILASGFGKTS